MADSNPQPEDVLTAYLEADSKYYINPVPTHFEDRRAVVARFIEEKATPDQTGQRTRKLALLAAYYDCDGTASSFLDMLNKRERGPDDYIRTAWAIEAVAWIGSDEEWQSAQRYYHLLLRRLDALRYHELMLEVCVALGPKEGTGPLREWIDRKIAELDADHKKSQESGDESQSELDWAKAQNLRELLTGRVSRVDEANALRLKIEGNKPELIGTRLVGLYSGDTPDSTEQLSYWAALRLVRLARRDPTARGDLSDEFVKGAKRNERDSGDGATESALRRARNLWAARLFGYEPDEETADWVAGQEDPGTDVLVLRPDWKYPSHVTEPASAPGQ